MDNVQNGTSPFGAPEAGNLQSGRQEFFPQVEYSTMKTPAHMVAAVNAELVANARATHKLGFHYYDKAASVRQSIDKFSFVVLEVYSGISGSRETQAGSGTWITYYSNYVKNSRNEPFALFEKGIKRPIATGFYEGKKDDSDFAKLVGPAGSKTKIPDGAGFHQHFIVYWIEGDKILDMKLTTMVSREIKAAISRAEASAGRKVKPERVNLFTLAEGGAFWGFQVTKFRRATKDGADYAGQGEMFLVPELACGVVKTEGAGANPELWAACKAHQDQIRAGYEAEVERRKRFGVENSATTNDAPVQGDERFPTDAPPATGRQSAVGYETAAANPSDTYTPPPPISGMPEPGDDLPF